MVARDQFAVRIRAPQPKHLAYFLGLVIPSSVEMLRILFLSSATMAD